MTFSGQAQTGVMGGDARKTRFIGLATALLITFFLLISAGCGGGGSDSPSNNGGGGPAGNSSDAFVTGRVVSSDGSQPVAGAIVQYGSIVAPPTGADGTFSIRVRSQNGTNVLKVTGFGSLKLYDYATINSVAYLIRTQGVPIPVLAAAQTYSVGNIQVSTMNDPPPPPRI